MSDCPNCGADMKHSPCCGRVAAYGDMKESLRLEVLENDRLRARVEELERELSHAKDLLQTSVDDHEQMCGEMNDVLRKYENEDDKDEWNTLDHTYAKAFERIITRLTTERNEYKDALVSIAEYWNRSENDRAMNDALYYMIDKAGDTLTGVV